LPSFAAARCAESCNPLPPPAPGSVPPLINAIKLYDTTADKIVADIELEWECSGGLQLGVSLAEGGAAPPGGLYLPVVADGIRFQGVIRVVMAPMLLAPPFVSAMTFAAVTPPNFDFRLSLLGGELSAIPGLREALQDYARSLVDATFVWPNRILLPFRRARSPADNLYFILSPEEQQAMRTEPYESLTDTRVASWGNRGLTRRIGRRYGPARRAGVPAAVKKKPLLSKALDWVKTLRSRSPEEEGVAAAAAAVAADAPAAAVAAVTAPEAAPIVPAVAAEALLLDVAVAAEARRVQRAAEWGRSGGMRPGKPSRPVQAPMPRRRPWWRFGR